MSGEDETEVKAIKSFCKGPYNVAVYLPHSSVRFYKGYCGTFLILIFLTAGVLAKPFVYVPPRRYNGGK